VGILALGMFEIACSALAQENRTRTAEQGSIVATMKADAEAVSEIVSNMWVAEWAKKAGDLPPIAPFTVTINSQTVTVDESVYYHRYGSPLAYARLLDLAITSGFEPEEGLRVFDFGYGSIGHLRMFACCGLRATGVDVAPLLKPMYADANGGFCNGSVAALDGRFPKEQELVERIGGDYALVISKNVLKKGYIHPAREADPRKLINLGVSDEAFLSHIHGMLREEGLFVIYNYCPPKAKQSEQYVPWADGESPFTREDFQNAGFEVLHFDVVDHAEARRHGHALGWDTPRGGNMKLETDLFAWYTIAKKRKPSPKLGGTTK
jgi:hypothetical protein